MKSTRSHASPGPADPTARSDADPRTEPDSLDAPELESPAGASADTTPVDPAGAAGAFASDELAEARDRWLRTEADFQNFRRRAARDLEESRRMAEESVLLELIGFLDDLERAAASAGSAGADPAWQQGVELVAQRMRDYLARVGVTPIESLGTPFDPREHEALLEMDAPDAAPGTVVSEIRKGYRRGDRMLRAARVAVSREPAAS